MPTADQVWRDYITDGVPSSGAHKPVKSEIREWAGDLEDTVIGSSYDATNAILRLGPDVYVDREPATSPNVAQGVVVIGADILEGVDVDATFSTFIGYRTGQNANHLYGCDWIGFRTGNAVTDGEYLGLFGIDAGTSLLTGRNSVLLGAHSGNHKTEIQSSTVLGVTAGYGGGTILSSVVIGNSTGDNNQSSDPINLENSVVIGNFAARLMDIAPGGTGNVVIGNNAGSLTSITGGFHTIVGRSAAPTLTTAVGCSFFGDSASGTATDGNQNSFGRGATCTGANQVTLGNASVATLRCQVTTITALSDERDKYDIEPMPLGLDFIRAAVADDAIVRHKWDARPDEFGDGRHTDEFEPGVTAQRLAKIEDDFGAQWMGLVDRRNPERLEATPGKLLFPALVAISELAAKVDELMAANDNLSARLAALEAA